MREGQSAGAPPSPLWHLAHPFNAVFTPQPLPPWIIIALRPGAAPAPPRGTALRGAGVQLAAPQERMDLIWLRPPGAGPPLLISKKSSRVPGSCGNLSPSQLNCFQFPL